MKSVDPVLEERLTTLVTAMGYELVGCELQPQGGRMIFRIYIDKLGNGEQGGITLDDCSLVSHQVSAMMDVDDPIQGRYALEISSPGIDRPLFRLEHYQKFVGSQVKMKLHTLVNQRRHYKGKLIKVVDDNIHLLVDDSEKEVVIPFSSIEKANLIGELQL